jgi:hypothetical protein
MDDLKGRNTPEVVADAGEKPVKQRAVRVAEIQQPDGTIVYQYSDGTIRNSNGTAAPGSPLPAGMAQPITADTARDMVLRREEKRMRLYAEGAQLAVARKDLIEKYGADAHIVERAITLQTIASTPDAGKAAVMADTALQRAQGYDTSKDNKAGGGTESDVIESVRGLLRDITDAARSLQAVNHD